MSKASALPRDFQFSQMSLQDFVDCPRRFQLRYLLRLSWPAVSSEPIKEHERRMMLGQAFHRMVRQSVLGIPEPRIMQQAHDPELIRWWESYLRYQPIAEFGGREGANVYSEVSLAVGFAGYRLLAKYDLLILRPGGKAVILDWKTSRMRVAASRLRNRLQSRVYPLLLVLAGDRLNAGQPVTPEQVEMVYWFPAFPHTPVRLAYGGSRYEADRAYLEHLIDTIAAAEGDFPLTEDEGKCRFCPYRSYCDRGTAAGQLEDVVTAVDVEAESSDADFDIDLDQIAEIAF